MAEVERREEEEDSLKGCWRHYNSSNLKSSKTNTKGSFLKEDVMPCLVEFKGRNGRSFVSRAHLDNLGTVETRN